MNLDHSITAFLREQSLVSIPFTSGERLVRSKTLRWVGCLSITMVAGFDRGAETGFSQSQIDTGHSHNGVLGEQHKRLLK